MPLLAASWFSLQRLSPSRNSGTPALAVLGSLVVGSRLERPFPPALFRPAAGARCLWPISAAPRWLSTSMKEALEAPVNSSSWSCRDNWMHSRLRAAKWWV